MKKRKKIKNNFRLRKGFTLIELLVTLTIFSLLIGLAIGIFTTALKTQRKSLALQGILDNTSYTLEYMARAIRMAQKETVAPTCLSQNGLNYELTRGERGIKFKNYRGICQEFFLENGQLKESKGGVVTNLTSNDLEVALFNLRLEGASDTDNFQPRVTIALDIKSKGQKQEEKTEMKVQTTISQRNPDLR
jgi:prepilin-type N-terminal cleavage/methylation domain-containing protein